MRPGIVHLRQFYSSRLGRRVKQRLRQIVLQHWPDQQEQEVIVGIGYAPPVLRVLDRAAGESSSILALMPADQGAIYWPVHTDNRSVLGDELMPPFAPNTVHRVLMLHALEFLPKPDELLRVYWQMLAPGGRLLIIVPNRRGFWSRMGRTPFARGTPYSMLELKDLLEAAQFTLRESSTALFMPPVTRVQRRGWGLLEWFGGVIAPGLGGVLVVEAEKQIYANLAAPVVEARRQQWTQAGVVATAERRQHQ